MMEDAATYTYKTTTFQSTLSLDLIRELREWFPIIDEHLGGLRRSETHASLLRLMERAAEQVLNCTDEGENDDNADAD